MRILFISTFYPPYVIGGWEQLVEDLNAGLRRRGHETFVLTSTHGVPDGEPALDSAANIDRSLLLESNLQFYRPTDMFSYRQRVQHNLDATRAAILRWQPDVIFIHIMWNLTRGIPWQAEQLASGRVVYYVADHWAYTPDAHQAYWTDDAGDPLRRAAKRMIAPLPLRIVAQDRKRFELGFEHVLCVSNAIRQSLLSHLSLSPQQVQVVYNGIDIDAFPFGERITAATSQGGELPPLRLLYAGSLVPHKGVHVAIDALGELAQQQALDGLTLTIVGSGRPDYEARLHEAVTAYGLQQVVQFVGRVPRSEMPSQLAAHDILIFPSEWPEPLARMTQEAMASGAVVIGTTTGGTGEILENGVTGLVFTPGDAVSLAARIRQLRSDPILFARLAAAARQRVEQQFGFERMLDQVEVALSSAVTTAGPGRQATLNEENIAPSAIVSSRPAGLS
jgi:glycogen(starch) synthase